MQGASAGLKAAIGLSCFVTSESCVVSSPELGSGSVRCVAGAVTVGVGVPGYPPCAGIGDVTAARGAVVEGGRFSRVRMFGARMVPWHLFSKCSLACSTE